MSLRDAATLLGILTEKLPPAEGKRHGIFVRDGRLALALQVGPGHQWWFFGDEDFEREPEELAAELLEMNPRYPIGENAPKVESPP